MLSSFCIGYVLIPSYVNLNPQLIHDDVTAPFTLLFAQSPQVYLCTRLVSNVATPIVWIFTQSLITSRASLVGNYLTGWSISGPWYRKNGKPCAPNITSSEICINPIGVVSSTPLSINPLSLFLHLHLRLLRCQPQPPHKLHGNWMQYASSIGYIPVYSHSLLLHSCHKRHLLVRPTEPQTCIACSAIGQSTTYIYVTRKTHSQMLPLQPCSASLRTK